MPRFDLRLVHTGFLVDELVPGMGFLRLLRLYPVTVIPRMRHVHQTPISYNLRNLQHRKVTVSLSSQRTWVNVVSEIVCRIGQPAIRVPPSFNSCR
jgi:hypothetical protein